ncbi:flagellar hook-associated protein 3 FlgL [Fictibacillus halophilus]|uniref:Flagellar hook-associated protein 3 FlgL n=1 Tax=Fictibacillus halophilus TaxID=1610490 RepID=A0ABV2LEK0_9BACL|nr:flagellar hook-associated protein FlgL [Fictibacillus halophilus]
MRVTQSILSGNMLKNIHQNYQRLGKVQEQLSTGKKITRPSDDPVIAVKGMNYRTNLTEVEQYERNLGEVYNWLENSEDALEKSSDVLQRVRELVVQASNDTYDEKQRNSIAQEVSQLKEQLLSIANTKVGGKYIFNGTNTQEERITNGVIDSSKTGKAVMLEISKGINIQANVDPDKVFNDDLINTLTLLVTDLQDPNSNNQSFQDDLTKLDQTLDTFNDERSELGAKYNRIELVEYRLSEQVVNTKKMISDNEDIDYEKAILDLKIQESIHRAALDTGARIIQPSLVDFLR